MPSRRAQGRAGRRRSPRYVRRRAGVPPRRPPPPPHSPTPPPGAAPRTSRAPPTHHLCDDSHTPEGPVATPWHAPGAARPRPWLARATRRMPLEDSTGHVAPNRGHDGAASLPHRATTASSLASGRRPVRRTVLSLPTGMARIGREGGARAARAGAVYASSSIRRRSVPPCRPSASTGLPLGRAAGRPLAADPSGPPRRVLGGGVGLAGSRARSGAPEAMSSGEAMSSCRARPFVGPICRARPLLSGSVLASAPRVVSARPGSPRPGSYRLGSSRLGRIPPAALHVLNPAVPLLGALSPARRPGRRLFYGGEQVTHGVHHSALEGICRRRPAPRHSLQRPVAALFVTSAPSTCRAPTVWQSFETNGSIPSVSFPSARRPAPALPSACRPARPSLGLPPINMPCSWRLRSALRSSQSTAESWQTCPPGPTSAGAGTRPARRV